MNEGVPRLSVHTKDAAPDWWRFDVDGEPFVEGSGASLCLKVKALCERIYERMYAETAHKRAGAGADQQTL